MYPASDAAYSRDPAWRGPAERWEPEAADREGLPLLRSDADLHRAFHRLRWKARAAGAGHVW